MNTLTDLERLLDEGETLINNKGDKLTKVDSRYWYVPFRDAAFSFRINQGIIPSEWHQRDQIRIKSVNPEEIAFEEFKNVPDDRLFPNHSDKDIWIAGFKAGMEYKEENSDATIKRGDIEI